MKILATFRNREFTIMLMEVELKDGITGWNVAIQKDGQETIDIECIEFNPARDLFNSLKIALQ